MPISLELAAGFNQSKFIDFGTSPIYYHGMLRQVSVAYRKATDKREVAYQANYASGKYQMEFNNMNLTSNVTTFFSFRHSRLFQLPVMKNSKWNVKVGGTFDALVLIRTNTGLMNNALGLDMFNNLFLSGKASKDISNETQKRWKFIKIKPKKRSLAYQLDAGIINANWRNNFIYSNSSPVYNEGKITAGHQYAMFSGFRMSSRLDYEHTTFNNNTIKYSYLWDAMMTGTNNNQDRLQLGNHLFLVSLNLKIR